MTAEELDGKLKSVSDWYATEMERLRIEMSVRIEAALKDAEGIPLHLTKASIDNMLKRMGEANQQITKIA